MILQKDSNVFTDHELCNIYENLHSVYKGFVLIDFLLNCDVNEQGCHYWIGTTQELARILGNGKGDNLCPSNFRNTVIQPLIDKGIITKEKLKRKTTKYTLLSNWKLAIFA